MQVVRFTKFWGALSVEEMGARAPALGYDGLDLAVRAGHPVHPGNVARALPRATEAWAREGLDCPLVTAETTLVDPGSPAARTLFEAAAAAGVELVKIGYFEYRPDTDFEAAWERARAALAGFCELARRTGVKAVYHTHGGTCLGSNCAGLRHLLADLDPRHVGAYVDLGHLAVNGEDVRLGLPMVRRHLAALAAKDARHVPDPRPRRPAAYSDAYVPLGEGAAEVAEAIRLLQEWRFDGPISVHTEYTADPEVVTAVGGRDDSAQAQAARLRGEVEDLALLRSLGA